jgi:integrase
MQKNGRAEGTIATHVERLKCLDKQCNITEPEEVKALLARLKWQTNTKLNVAIIYDGFLKSIGKTWSRPEYKHESGLPPFIPMEAEIDSLISAATPKTATLLQALKETGARIGEMARVTWKDIDFERKAIYIRAEKGSNSRILPISDKLIAMFHRMPKTDEKVFRAKIHGLRTTFEKLRHRTAVKLNNPRLENISFHTFRHWKATMEYHRIQDIVTVKKMLGHKSIDSTMVYINIESALFLSQNDEWICKATRDPVEAQKLVEAGFQYVLTTPDGLMMFRKRK